VGEAIALAGFVQATDRAAKPLLARDQYGRHFLVGAVGLGIVIPLLAFAASPTRRGRATAVASLCSLVGGILLRYAFVEGGRASAEDPSATFWHTDLPEEKRGR
jgi:formate-dependent nitrite reductase membrane component NrfD